MRNLKKTLCLVLALVFVLGLCTVGAVNGTDFSDKAEIKYDTAVKAMSGLGILKGDDNDGDGKFEFRPADDVTRAEAAKIIAYLVVGEEAEKWPARQVFDDVPADHWAARYVAYCQHNGIIAGYGNGKFGPNDKVTQAQFAKMILASCGYGAKGEFEGAGWDQNVAKVAMKTGVLKGLLNANWDAPANREETAQLAYNGLMNVVQVVVNKDTDSYEPMYINDQWNVTLGGSTWKLKTVEGIIVANKGTDSSKKGTILAGNPSGIKFFVTEEDANYKLLGHQVKITYRLEMVNGEETAIAYYVDDGCKEVPMGAMCLDAETVAQPRTFDKGIDKGYVTTGTNVIPDANTRARNKSFNTFVLNDDGKIVSMKISGYFLAPLTITNGKATFTEPYNGSRISVTAPEGAKTGEIYTITPYDKEYVLEACSVEKGVKILQTKQDPDYLSWTYNDGKYSFSRANKAQLTVPVGITAPAGDSNATTSQLSIGSTYTLYKDSKGGWYGYVEEASGTTSINDFVYVTKVYTTNDGFGVNVPVVQAIKADGTIVNGLKYTVPAGAYDAPAANHVYRIVSKGSDGYAFIGENNNNTAWGTPKLRIKEADPYTKKPTVDLGSAKTVWFTGVGSTLETSTKESPALDISAGGTVVSNLYYVYALVEEGTTSVWKVQAVWFTSASDSYAEETYIYVTRADTKFTNLVNGKDVDFYFGYKDGVEMNDLKLQRDSSGFPTGDSIVGGNFYSYTVNGSGEYKLKAVTPYTVDDTKTNAQTVLLVAGDAANYILGGNLYIGDSDPISLADVKVVRFPRTHSFMPGWEATADEDYNENDADPTKAVLTIDSVAAIENAMALGYKVEIRFVENIVEKTHSVGGGVIYVTMVVK